MSEYVTPKMEVLKLLERAIQITPHIEDSDFHTMTDPERRELHQIAAELASLKARLGKF